MASPRQDLVRDDSESLREDDAVVILGRKDKGKAPIRVHRDFVDGRYPQNTEIPNANPHPHTDPTNSQCRSRNENLESPESSAASSVLNEPLSEYGIKLKTQLLSPRPSLEALSVESDCESFRTASPKLYLDDDDQEREQKQGRKQEQQRQEEAESDHEPEPQPHPYPADQDPAASGPHTNEEEAESPTFRPPRLGDPGWEKSADRPPKKLPIRFKDAVGRKFIFPWEKAKTWAGMERLIRNCFVYVDVIGPHVIKGHYDLFTFHLPFSTDTGFEMAPQAAASEPAGVQQHPGIEAHMAGSSNHPPIPHAPTPPPAPTLTPIEQSAVTILPELWEDLVEPGMFILMQMWPMAPPALPPPPMQHPPPGPPGILGGYVGGRGRGRGSGGGRGMGPPLGPPPGWMVVERPPKPRGKTRKRRDGP
ncbi:hypothetical protein F5Y00DRAFT_230738 [Daldinia vernicosa]|uniref:uncharacterized protein n=1 Tax=Daldinia vernicosa TaxID=114800 RepID=UPI0020071E19|nr:uncharacterized protein F5Y00DRAFT_230738 [Daldinia vernicosa]KAI0851249.1 hypothetical protein F5Y00DRAFT_230738 [Daldinia vernicosa]